ncbi:MAG: VWA domain-containing protein [Candidatus Aminicenantes bacterium]|nr:VWA domain-containing protein [Candidatus Aminicenantes bacterium]MDH5742800.1 VWA domain-containing protein [Candidatus Aminicenantes bacterium]
MEKRFFLSDDVKHFPSILLIGIFFLLVAFGARSFSADKVLFKSHFSDLRENWEVWDDSSASPQKSQWDVVLTEYSGITNPLRVPASLLTAGEKTWTNYSVRSHLFIESSQGDLTGLVFGHRDPDHYYIAGYNFNKNGYELKAKTPIGFETLAFARMNIPRNKWVPIQVDFLEKRMLFKAGGQILFDLDNQLYASGQVGVGTSHLGIGAVVLKGLEVTQLDPQTLRSRDLQDLLAGNRGATVIYMPSVPKSDPFTEAIDHSLEDEKNMGGNYNLDLSKSPLPEEAVFCFPQERFVEIHRIGVKLGKSRFPKEIKFWVSDQTPKTGFVPLTAITLEPKTDSYQEFKVNPTRAKYLKIQITASHDPKAIEIPDLFVKGFFQEKAAHRGDREAFQDTKLQEKEGNNSPAEAQELPLKQALKGEVARGDVDYYKISLKGHSGNTLNLRIDSADIVRPEYELQTPEGGAVKPSRVSNAGTWMKVSYQLQPADYYLKIWRPDAYLSIVYDDSGSMRSSVETVNRVLTGYLDRIGEGLNLRLLKYTDEAKFLSEFTNNPDELKEALVKQVKGGGGTDTFKGLSAAVGSLKAQPGSRAVLAIFDVIDCSGSDYLQKYLGLWDAILDDAVSFNVIAVQPGWDRNTPYFNNTREQIFKEIAYASRGQFYHSPFDEQIAQSSDQIFKQLTSPSIYRIEAEWIQTETKPGSIEILFEEGAEKQAAKNVELILDASNSMWGQIQGEAKITIAKKVLSQIIDGLPEEMNVGLRVYGHRYKLNDSKACQDTELVAPIGSIDKTRLNAEVDTITPRGEKPRLFTPFLRVSKTSKI